MKIRKNDLPNKDFEKNNVMCSIIKAINNNREGTYTDCFFKNEEDFINILNALEEMKIIKKKIIDTQNYNLENYVIVKNLNFNLKNRNSIKNWLIDNAVGLISLIPSIIQLIDLVKK